MQKTKNVVGYVRVSTIEQAQEGFSIEAQQSEIKKYCVTHGYNLVNFYIDAGLSGTDVTNRVAYQKMINDIKQGNNINSVVVWKLSRLSRKMKDLVNTIDLFEKYNIDFRSIDDNIDTSTHMGKAFVMLSGVFAELERDNIVSNVTFGMKERANEGRWNGGAVTGYDSNDDKELIVNDREALIVKEIFHLFADENWGYKKIAISLNNKGFKTIKGKDWSINSIKQIIDNPIYAGYVRWGKHMEWSKKRRKGIQDEYILKKGIHEPIITEEIWEKAKKIREIRGVQSTKSYNGDFLLSGLIKCPHCGASMISCKTSKRSKTGEFYRYYQCSAFFNKGTSVCNANLIRAGLAEEYVLDKLFSIAGSEQVIESIIKKSEQESAVDTTPIVKKVEKLQRELNKIETKQQEALEQELKEDLDSDIVNQRLSFFNIRKNEILKEINLANNELSNIDNRTKIKPDVIRNVLTNFVSIFEKSNIEKRKLLIKSLIDKIIITQGKSSKDRKVEKVILFFDAEEVNAEKKFPTTYDTVLP